MPSAVSDERAAAGGSAALLRGYSIEAIPRDPSVVDVCRANLAAGTEIYIAFVPRESRQSVIEMAGRLRDAGFVPVPHIVARSLPSYTRLRDFLARLSGEAGVTKALVVAGDLARAVGPYDSSLQLLQSGLFQEYGINRIGIACYPEAHQRINDAGLDEALAAKLDCVERAGLDAWLVTQFCFDAAVIIERIARLRRSNVATPVRVGIVGPANRRALFKFALRCGIGNSIRALGSHVDAVANLLVRDAPDALLGELAAASARNPGLGIEGIHIFTFGGVSGAAQWANARLAAMPAGISPPATI